MHSDAGTIQSPVEDRALYERLLEQRRTLRFPTDLERAFRLHFLREGRPRIRLGMWTGLVLFAAYAAWDLATFPAELLAWSLLCDCCASVHSMPRCSSRATSANASA